MSFYGLDPSLTETIVPGGARVLYKDTVAAAGAGTHTGFYITPGARGCWVDMFQVTPTVALGFLFTCQPDTVSGVGSLGTATLVAHNVAAASLKMTVQTVTWTVATPDGYIDQGNASATSAANQSVGQLAPNLLPWYIPSNMRGFYVTASSNQTFNGMIGLREA